MPPLTADRIQKPGVDTSLGSVFIWSWPASLYDGSQAD